MILSLLLFFSSPLMTHNHLCIASYTGHCSFKLKSKYCKMTNCISDCTSRYPIPLVQTMSYCRVSKRSPWLEKDVQGCGVKVTEGSNSFWGPWWVNSMCTTAPTNVLFIQLDRNAKQHLLSCFCPFPLPLGLRKPVNCRSWADWAEVCWAFIQLLQGRKGREEASCFHITPFVDKGKAKLGHI